MTHQSMGIEEGDAVLWELREAKAGIRKFVPAGVYLADQLIAERRADNAQDESARWWPIVQRFCAISMVSPAPKWLPNINSP